MLSSLKRASHSSFAEADFRSALQDPTVTDIFLRSSIRLTPESWGQPVNVTRPVVVRGKDPASTLIDFSWLVALGECRCRGASPRLQLSCATCSSFPLAAPACGDESRACVTFKNLKLSKAFNAVPNQVVRQSIPYNSRLRGSAAPTVVAHSPSVG